MTEGSFFILGHKMLGGKGRFTRSLMGLILLHFLAPVQLGKHILELLRDGQTDVSSVLQQRQSLISFLLVNFSQRDSAIIESFDRKNMTKRRPCTALNKNP